MTRFGRLMSIALALLVLDQVHGGDPGSNNVRQNTNTNTNTNTKTTTTTTTTKTTFTGVTVKVLEKGGTCGDKDFVGVCSDVGYDCSLPEGRMEMAQSPQCIPVHAKTEGSAPWQPCGIKKPVTAAPSTATPSKGGGGDPTQQGMNLRRLGASTDPSQGKPSIDTTPSTSTPTDDNEKKCYNNFKCYCSKPEVCMCIPPDSAALYLEKTKGQPCSCGKDEYCQYTANGVVCGKRPAVNQAIGMGPPDDPFQGATAPPTSNPAKQSAPANL